jgi:hypothetical protein
MFSLRSPRCRAPLWRLISVLAVTSALAACGGSSSNSSTAQSGSGGTQPSEAPASTGGDGTPATVVSGDFTLQAGSYYDRAAANLAGTADRYNLDVESDGLHVEGMVATLDPSTIGSYQVCSHTQPQVNLELTMTWSELAGGGQYCVSDLGLGTISLLTVHAAAQGSSVTLHVETWPCTDEECWSVSDAS